MKGYKQPGKKKWSRLGFMKHGDSNHARIDGGDINLGRRQVSAICKELGITRKQYRKLQKKRRREVLNN